MEIALSTIGAQKLRPSAGIHSRPAFRAQAKGFGLAETSGHAADSIAHGSLRSGGLRRCAVVPCGPGRRLGAARTASGPAAIQIEGCDRLNLSGGATAMTDR